jgi:hypothetical protein
MNKELPPDSERLQRDHDNMKPEQEKKPEVPEHIRAEAFKRYPDDYLLPRETRLENAARREVFNFGALYGYDQLRAENDRLKFDGLHKDKLIQNLQDEIALARSIISDREKENAELKAVRNTYNELNERLMRKIVGLRETISQLIPIAEAKCTHEYLHGDFKEYERLAAILLKAKEAIK